MVQSRVQNWCIIHINYIPTTDLPFLIQDGILVYYLDNTITYIYINIHTRETNSNIFLRRGIYIFNRWEKKTYMCWFRFPKVSNHIHIIQDVAKRSATFWRLIKEEEKPWNLSKFVFVRLIYIIHIIIFISGFLKLYYVEVRLCF